MNILTKDSKMIPMMVNKTDFFASTGKYPLLCSVELDVVAFFVLLVVVCNVDSVLVVSEETLSAL